VVDESNLQRQIIFGTGDVGEKKAVAAAARLHQLNPFVNVYPVPIAADAGNVATIIEHADVVVDGTDRYRTRYLINDACRLAGKPLVFGSLFRFEGQVAVFGAGDGPCYRCLFPAPPPSDLIPSCADGGVFGVVAGQVATHQGGEVLKLLLGIGEPLIGRMMLIDSLGGRVHEIAVSKRRNCALCGESPTIRTVCDIDSGEVAADDEVPSLHVAQLDEALSGGMRVLDVREPHEAPFGTFPGALAIPASQLEARLGELELEGTYVVGCRIGERSRTAVKRLRQAGFTKVRHLEGGFLAYDAELLAF